MISAGSFIQQAQLRGFDFYTGVPCSFLTPLINGVISTPGLDYVGAASEGEAVAHIPAHKHGLLGRLSQADREKVREYLGGRLKR